MFKTQVGQCFEMKQIIIYKLIHINSNFSKTSQTMFWNESIIYKLIFIQFKDKQPKSLMATFSSHVMVVFRTAYKDI